MPKRVASYVVHYGSEYLGYSVRSIMDVVDEIHVLYSSSPSFRPGSTALPCPDTEERLREEAYRYLRDAARLRWVPVRASSEEDHRTQLLQLAKEASAEQLLVVDADEVWDPAAAAATLDYTWREASCARWGVCFMNFWQSFRWVVEDAFRPIRIVDFRHPLGSDFKATTLGDGQPLPVYHFGYAQTEATMRYKMSCHGHTIRPGWLEETFLPWRPGSSNDGLHPEIVGQFWDPKPTDAQTLAKLQELLVGHPHWDKEPIR